MGFGKFLIQGIIFVMLYATYDFYLRDWYFGTLEAGGESATLPQVAVPYLGLFLTSWLMSFLLIKKLRVDEDSSSEGYE